MRQFRTIAVNALMELIRRPVFRLLAGSVWFEIFLAVPGYSVFGNKRKLVIARALA
jgi:hypothetical protein